MADERLDPEVAERYEAEAWTCQACRAEHFERRKLESYEGGLEGVYIFLKDKRLNLSN